MSILSPSSFLDKGHQVDLEMVNVDSIIQRANQLAPDPLQFMTWTGLKSEWDKYYQENIVSVPFFPQSDSDLNTWLSRIAEWKTRGAAWAKTTGDPGLAQVAQNLPTSVAATEHAEDAAKPSYAWLVPVGVGTVVIFGLGYVLSSGAKLKGAFKL